MRRFLALAIAALACMCHVAGADEGWRSAAVDSAGHKWVAHTAIKDELPEAVYAQRVNVVRIQYGRSQGSGTYLGDRLVLTCSHLLRGEREGLTADVKFAFGKRYRGTVLKYDFGYDIALLELDQSPPYVGVPFAEANPRQGDFVTFMGFPQGAWNLYGVRPAQVVEYSRPAPEAPTDWFESSVPVIGGYSGGPAFSRTGHLYGNLWGSGRGRTIAVSTGRVLGWMGQAYLQRLRRWHVRYAQCGPGGCSTGGGFSGGAQITIGGRRFPPSRGGAPVFPSGPGNPTPVPTSPAQTVASPPRSDAIEKLQAQVQSLRDDLQKSTFAKPGPKGDKGDPGSAGPPGPMGPQGPGVDAAEIGGLVNQLIDAKLAARDAQLEQRLQQHTADILQQFEARMDAKASSGGEASQPSPFTDANGRELVLYYTSDACTECDRVDAKINELRAKGYPIIITKLAPKAAEVTGVPRLFFTKTNKQVAGISNCLTQLALLTPR